MEISKAQLENFVKRIESSMKYQEVSGISADELIEKYENLLYEREKQIRDLSCQMGLINEKLFDAKDKYQRLILENSSLDEKNEKSVKKLKREVESRKIMSQKIEVLVKDNSILRENIKNNIGTGKRRSESAIKKSKTTNYDNILSKGKNSNIDLSQTQILMSENINYVPVFK